MKSEHGIDKISKCMATLIFSTCVITACSNGSDSGSIENQAPQLSLTPSSSSPLVQSAGIDADMYIKNGLYILGTQGLSESGDASADAPPTPTPNFSSTNIQISGVDEADRIEYDGAYMYVAQLPTAVMSSDEAPLEMSNSVSIFQRDANFSLTPIADIPLDTDAPISGIYLNEDNLGILTSTFDYYPVDVASTETSLWQNPDIETHIDIIDVSTPELPAKTYQISVDGSLIDSRRIDNDLYIALQYVPHIGNLPAVNSSDKSRLNYYQHLLLLDDEDLTPQITINDQTLPLYDINTCLLPENATSKNGHVQTVSVLKINMASPENYSAKCMVVEAHGLFMSNENLYLYAQQYNDTVFHKVSFNDDITYEASGNVKGIFGWNSAPQFKMAEKDGHFVTVTSEGLWDGSPKHYLHVLQQQGSQLVEVATLPNNDAPAPIGKPGEEIYAVRFYKDKAYIVTFERIDPLYVIDLTAVEAPVIQGELSIPGFSSYLHPMDNGLLLGVGQQINVGNLPMPGGQPATTPVEEGMKVSLFDVLDPQNPILLQDFVWSDSYTPVEFDHRALSVLKTEQGYRFALPSETWSTDGEYWALQYALHMLEVDSDERTLTLVDSVNHNPGDENSDNENYYGSHEDRSVLHGNHVYYLRGNNLYHTQWLQGAPVDGPF